MFKWLKKIMISIINSIRSLFLGDKQVQSVSIGDHQVYPEEIEYATVRLVKSAAVRYSSGSKINAAGSNYAKIIGSVDVYTVNLTYGGRTHEGEEEVELTPTSASNWDWVALSGNKVVAQGSREDVIGDERSVIIYWTLPDGYSLNEDYMTTPEGVSVVQEANTMSTSTGAITDFRLNGQNTIISIDDAARDLYISTIAGYRNVTYTSGYTTTISIPNTGYVYTISGGDGWTTLNYNGSIVQSISVTANNTGSTREAVVTVKDGYYPSAQASIRIKQAVPWVLSVSSPVYIAYDATSFSFNVTSTNNGVAAPITSSMVSIVTNNSNLSLTGIVAVSGSTGVYKLSFSCSVNTDTSNTKTSQVRITRSDHTEAPRTVSVIQAANNSAFEYIDNQHVSSNAHWILGTVTIGRTEHFGVDGTNVANTGIIIACDSPITEDKTIRISSIVVQRRDPSTQGMPGRTYTANSVVQTITAGTELEVSFNFTNVGGDSYTKTYYGAWLRISGVTWSPPNWVESSGYNTIFQPVATTQINSVGTITVS